MTDRARLGAGSGDACLIRQARYAVEAGVDAVQIRDRALEARELAGLVRAVLQIARGTSTRVFVNDRLDVAIAAGADGVHLRSDSLPPRAARKLAPRGFIIGQSVHSAAEARAAGGDVDYLVAGTVFPSRSKPTDQPTLGLAGLAEIVAAADVPVIAIGGMTVERAGDAARAGAAGIAAIGLFMAEKPDGSGCRATPLGGTVSALRARLA